MAGTAEGLYVDVSADSGFDDQIPAHLSRGIILADIDGDGDDDLLVAAQGDDFKVYRNDSEVVANRAVRIELVGDVAVVNRDAIGSIVEVTIDGTTQAQQLFTGGSLGTNQVRTMVFGVGAAEVVEQVRVIWPNGAVTILNDVDPALPLRVDQRTTAQ